MLPAFEMKSTKASEMPKDKTRLIELLDDGAVRPFYYEICFKCQKPTDYERWRRLVLVTSNDNCMYGSTALFTRR